MSEPHNVSPLPPGACPADLEKLRAENRRTDMQLLAVWVSSPSGTEGGCEPGERQGRVRETLTAGPWSSSLSLPLRGFALSQVES